MSRSRTLIAAASAAVAMIGTTIVAGSGLAAAAPAPGPARIEGSAVPFTSHTTASGAVAASQKLAVQVWLRPRLNQAQRFAAAVSTPGSASFHHYLSPASYAARFGASIAETARIESWLRGAGFTSVTASPLRSYVRATGPASVINTAFHTQLKLYPATAGVSAGRYQLRANDGPISVPSSLSGSVLGVTGLSNAAPVLPLQRPSATAIGKTTPHTTVTAKPTAASCSFYYGEHYATGLPRQFGVTSFPTDNCGYSGTQLRKAYGASTAATGQGQTVALVELGLTPDMFLTLHDYARKNGLPAPAGSRYSELSLGRGSQCGDPFDIEEQLDVEMSYAMAPAAHQLVVGGDSCNQGDAGLQGLFNADLAVLGTGRHPLATVASNSWEGGTEGQAPFLTNIEHGILVQAAAEGVGMYFSSGDGSGVLSPSSDPDAIAVGGTTLGIGKGGSRLFETGWSEGISLLNRKSWAFLGEFGAAGGGPSLLWAEPSYQDGVVPAALATAPGNRGGVVRSVPDISADADPFTGAAVGVLTFHNKSGKPPTYGQFPVGGTSEAAPLVAGMVAAAQQGQPASFGLVNPALYQLSGSRALYDALPLTSSSPAAYRGVACSPHDCGLWALTTFDDQSNNMFGYTGQVTLPGYDNMAGVGTPAGPAFISGLRSIEG
ncbi:MAG TPA: S53 family serine peptidase [Streptosporangiaceae bacterium]